MYIHIHTIRVHYRTMRTKVCIKTVYMCTDISANRRIFPDEKNNFRTNLVFPLLSTVIKKRFIYVLSYRSLGIRGLGIVLRYTNKDFPPVYPVTRITIGYFMFGHGNVGCKFLFASYLWASYILTCIR